MKITKYLTWVCNLSLQLLSLISYSRGSCFEDDLNMISSVLVSVNESLLPLNHWTLCFNSLLMTDSVVPSFLVEHIRLALFVKLWMIGFENAHCRSLMYRRNNKGPNVDPWGVYFDARKDSMKRNTLFTIFKERS